MLTLFGNSSGLESLSLNKKVVLVLLAAVFALGLGLLMGKLFFPSASQKEGERSAASQTPPVETSLTVLKGVIRPGDKSRFDQGTHQLTDEDGKTIAVLAPSKKIADLTFLEGAEVEVEGKAARFYDKIPLIEVEKVRF